jgi:hypothetical protein
MSRQSVLRAALGLSVAACVALAEASPAPPTEPTPAAAVKPATPAAAPGTAGLQAFTDPVTGVLREATSEDLARIAATHPIPLRVDADLSIIVHADGMKSLILDDSFLSTSVARIGPDGSLITGCVTTREEYDAFFAATPAIAEEEVR